MGKPRDTKIAILPSTTRKGTILSTSATLDSPSVIDKLVSPPHASHAGTSAESEHSHNIDNVSAVLDDSGSLGSFLDATIAKSRQIENTETPNATTPVSSPELDYFSDDLEEDYVELDDDFIEKCNATTDARKIKKLLAEHAVRYKLSPDPKFATSPINIRDKDYDFSLDLSHIAIVEKTPFCGTEKESAVEHMTELSTLSSLFSDDVKKRTYFVAKIFPFSLKDDAKTWKRTPDEAEELLAKIGRNYDDWNTPEPTPTPIVKKRGLIKLNDEDMREAKKSLKEKGIKSEDVKNLPPIEDICEIIPPSSMIEDPLYPEGHPKRIEQDSQRIEPSAHSKKKKKKKHKNVVESSEPVNDPNSISISDAESGNEHDNDKDNDKNDTPDKEEVEEEPEKHAKNKKYTKEDFITEKHGSMLAPESLVLRRTANNLHVFLDSLRDAPGTPDTMKSDAKRCGLPHVGDVLHKPLIHAFFLVAPSFPRLPPLRRRWICRPFERLFSESRRRRRGWRSRRTFHRSRLAIASLNVASNPPHLRAQKVLDDLPDMDSEDEMAALLLEDEQAFDDDLREHLLIIASLQDMLDAEAEKRKRPRRGGSRPGRRKSKAGIPAEDGGACHAAQRLLHRRFNTCRQFSAPDCVIMHNMIIEDDRKNHARTHVGPYECEGPLAEVDHELPADFADFLTIRDSNVHEQLQADLVEHLWRIKGNTVPP
ncbi:hypothetical protein QYE76_046011 [Lolium multiflorum]|uniref:Uncharacterized protein n=1 Tax=Lolium multiflorum TaxID=4521 RepID=A0AAD8TP48_LOLMU|nr:hypothetical protein QYE76_046011 [Lolium multiflorum]